MMVVDCQKMSRTSRVATAFLLVFAFGNMPLAADWCAATCEAAHAATAVGAAPTCHHTGAAVAWMSGGPKACSHDHNGVLSVAAPSPPPAPPHQWKPAAVSNLYVDASSTHRIDTTGRASPRVPPLIQSSPLTLSTILRI